ncbi:MAG: hypothetical protein CVT49_11270 [candidate division Zixibacteria bacterium HGW-Zixibacteria-1]|nr:MAG: hypothetical protein CVT49_11270 [candidate division Zixibacteria bacterium HGW-Zixibacteria-1]
MSVIYYTIPDNIIEEWLYLKGEEAHHARNVMRLKKGDTLIAVDGVGNAYNCVIEKSSAGEVRCKIISRIRNFGESMCRVTVAAGLSTGYKFDEVIQRCTELGVSRFIPMLTEKSKVKMENEKRVNNKLARWVKVAAASMKQTRRAFLPVIETIVDFDQAIAMVKDDGRKILFDPTYGKKSLDKALFRQDDKQISLFIGPESGFSPDEAKLAEENGFQLATLGSRVLRTENASPTAAAIVMNLIGELR